MREDTVTNAQVKTQSLPANSHMKTEGILVAVYMIYPYLTLGIGIVYLQPGAPRGNFP
jgi:hypothetical protein